MSLFRCVNCSATSENGLLDPSCPRCGSAVVMSELGPQSLERDSLARLPPGVWRFRAFLPFPMGGNPVTLGEGGTPLTFAPRLGKELGLDRLLIKDETRNPTGSFIDRGATVLASLARERGVKGCSCVTTGNLGASLAAYCAKGGIAARIMIGPNTDREKLYQMIAYGAEVENLPSSRESPSSDNRSLFVTAANPYLLEGEKTTCFEIIQDLDWNPPDVIIVPVGTGGHLSMSWRAVLQLRRSGLIGRSKCRLVGVQFAGSAPIVGRRPRSVAPGAEHLTELEESDPLFRTEAIRAMKDSGGDGVETTSDETVRATGLLARTEGVFAEPAAASVVAVLKKAKREGMIAKDETVVCVITGAGLKDTKAISKIARATKQVVATRDYSPARMQVGDTKLALINAMATKPRFGYELWKDLSAGRNITTASVYQHLAELEELGLVRKSGAATILGRVRVYYELTRRGSDLLKIASRIEDLRSSN